jgi:hypothetical protein
MKYSIFILLFFIYALLTLIALYVVRMMRRETSLEAAGPSPAANGGFSQKRS